MDSYPTSIVNDYFELAKEMSRRGALNRDANNIRTPVAMPHDQCFILLPVYSELKDVPLGITRRATRDNCV